MTRVAPIPPAESDLLCEFCGYTLNGLSDDSNCPECGMPIAASKTSNRQPPLWERKRWAFVATTLQIIRHPTEFFSGMTARGDVERAAEFAYSHWLLASVLLVAAAVFHMGLFYQMGDVSPEGFLVILLLIFMAYWSLKLTTWLAVRLTAWEAAYRGIRLPPPVVRRGMYYHAAHYLPVAALGAATVIVYSQLFRNRLVSADTLVPYLYVLCAEIILAAAYLFKTYWIGMRNMMYANR